MVTGRSPTDVFLHGQPIAQPASQSALSNPAPEKPQCSGLREIVLGSFPVENRASPKEILQNVTVQARPLSASLAVHKNSRILRSTLEFISCTIAFAGLWVAMWWLRDISIILTLLLAIPTAGFMVRLFMIQHDCGHGSFFKSRLANDWVGRFISVFTLTPYDFWRQSHAMHHARSRYLDRRGIGDIDTLTVREFLALGKHGQLRYRLYPHPLVMFRIRASLSVPVSTSPSVWRDAGGGDALDQYHAHKSWNRDGCSIGHLCGRHGCIFRNPDSYRTDWSIDWGLAFFCAASI